MAEPEDVLNCLSCGYNLTGLRDNRCPEGGTAFSREALRRRRAEEAVGITVGMLSVRLLSAPALVWLSALLHELRSSTLWNGICTVALIAAVLVGAVNSILLAWDMKAVSRHRAILFVFLLIAIAHLMIVITAAPS